MKEVFLAREEGKLAKDFETRGQFKKAALGTMNNIAEGFGRFSDAGSIRFYDFSQSSAQEVQSMLYALEDVGYLPPEKIQMLRSKTDATKNLTLGLISYMRGKG